MNRRSRRNYQAKATIIATAGAGIGEGRGNKDEIHGFVCGRIAYRQYGD